MMLNGVVREFIQKCMVGGRTMTRENKKWKVDLDLDDFDAVSLYPSAMDRLGGYLQGCPKILETNGKTQEQLRSEINNYDGFFIECVVKKVGIHRQFPLLSVVEDGIRNFTKDIYLQHPFHFHRPIIREEPKKVHEQFHHHHHHHFPSFNVNVDGGAPFTEE